MISSRDKIVNVPALRLILMGLLMLSGALALPVRAQQSVTSATLSGHAEDASEHADRYRSGELLHELELVPG